MQNGTSPRGSTATPRSLDALKPCQSEPWTDETIPRPSWELQRYQDRPTTYQEYLSSPGHYPFCEGGYSVPWQIKSGSDHGLWLFKIVSIYVLELYVTKRKPKEKIKYPDYIQRQAAVGQYGQFLDSIQQQRVGHVQVAGSAPCSTPCCRP
jgi:hypothetical protein